ncbi:MAG: type II toxin-antitoxin system RelE/ParE family toxin [Ginsengibacter sp.]
MNYKISYTHPFAKELKHLAKKYPSIKADVSNLIKELQINPLMGIPIGNNFYKIRLAIQSKGKGKSGGARVITYVQVVNENIFLIAIYDKSESGNISDKELENRLKKL